MGEQTWLMFAERIFTFAQPIIWVVVLWVWWSLKKLFVPISKHDEDQAVLIVRFEKNEARQDKAESRLIKLEDAIENLPTAQDVNDIKASLTEMDGKLSAMSENNKGRSNTLEAGMSAMNQNLALLLELHLTEK